MDLIPERRAKSWKREHEERCRRHSDLKKYRGHGNGLEFVVTGIKENSSDYMDGISDEMEKM